MKHSIASLMALIAVVGVSVAALKSASDVWAAVLLLLTLGILGASIIGSAHGPARDRAWWFGFALFGWGYLVLAQAPWISEQIAPRLPTTMALDSLHSRLRSSSPNGTGVKYLTRTVTKPQTVFESRRQSATAEFKVVPVTRYVTQAVVVQAPKIKLEQFRRVGQPLFALLAAVIGGAIGRWFARRQRESEATVV